MPDMPYEAVFFDFDGTLVDSAQAKRDAFFDLFPSTPQHAHAVQQVLSADPDGSRYRVIPRMLTTVREARLGMPRDIHADRLIERYSENVLRAVSGAPEMPGVSGLLEYLFLNGVKLYLCSNTPQQDLLYLVEKRKWKRCFREIVGYPRIKQEFVHAKLADGDIAPERAAFVGDGATDEEAARRNSVQFYAIRNPGDFETVTARLKGQLNV